MRSIQTISILWIFSGLFKRAQKASDHNKWMICDYNKRRDVFLRSKSLILDFFHSQTSSIHNFGFRWEKRRICETIWSRVAIWPFLKLFARNKMVLPFGHFFGLFRKLKKIAPFRACFGKIWSKITIFYKINSSYFTKISSIIWPLFCLFSFLRIWPFLKLLMANVILWTPV